MVYFRKIDLPGCTSPELEMALRKVALKSTSMLDMGSSTINIGTDKYFIGYQGKKTLTFTRIRAFIESVLPKLIIRPSNSNEECYYQLRLSAISFFIFLIFNLFELVVILSVVLHKATLEGLITVSIFCSFYWLLLFIEFKLKERRINKAIRYHSRAE
jgi:hypothetical protein